jgi:hypothetical protein
LRSFSYAKKGEIKMNQKIFNGTPHDVVIIDDSEVVYNDSIRKHVCSASSPKTVAKIPSNGILSAKMETARKGHVENIPIFHKRIVGYDTVPSGYDIVIVSVLYATAVAKAGVDVSSLYTIADPVYSADGRTILGCRGITKVD